MKTSLAARTDRAVACVLAACALACMLALAATQAAFAEGELNESNEGSTTSKVTTESHLSAVVPLTLGVEASIDGGSLSAVSAGYAITNKSYFDIYVTNVKAEAQGNWQYSASPFASSGTSATVGKTGDINLALTPAGGQKKVLDGTGQTVSWTLGAATSSAGTETAIAVEGSTSVLTGVVSDDPAVKITYTISPTASV